MSRISELKDRVSELSIQLRDAQAELRQARLEAAPLKIGDVVTFKTRHAQIEGIVREIDPWSDSGGWCRIATRNKNGEWSKSLRGEAMSSLTLKERPDG